jgi:hypothetical protein
MAMGWQFLILLSRPATVLSRLELREARIKRPQGTTPCRMAWRLARLDQQSLCLGGWRGRLDDRIGGVE